MTVTAQLRIGISGWVYKHWMGVFYPEKMRDFRAQGIDGYAYSNNDPGSHALDDAARLRAMPEQ